MKPRIAAPRRAAPRAAPRPARVGPQWFLAPRPETPSLTIHDAARFGCAGAGTCCDSGFVISVDADEAARLRAAARALHGETSDDPLVALPRTGRRPATLALVTSPRCAFLDDARRCSIHGQDAQPAPCRVFPYRFVAAGDVVHVSVAHRCVCGALDRGALVSAQHADVARRLATMPLVHALPAVTAIDDDTDAPTADVLDALRRATAATGPFEILGGLASDLAALAPRRRRAHRRVRTLAPRTIAQRLDAAATACGATPIVHAALRAAPHPRHAALTDALVRTGLTEPGADPVAEVGRFVRDWIFGLQPWRFSTLGGALTAAGLAAARILHALPAEGAHAIARARILAWESTLGFDAIAGLFGDRGPIAALTADLATVRAALTRAEALTFDDDTGPTARGER